ncbi:uncharacterized protein LOC116303736 [Actinia tenebrosa]|uniref:Uncharacterized protein LOC116303736 n=1 Tax=Actinia tenebrosa TaxID=6105 RepID=A0A6P8IQI6_ACTTE|nr:uncharacterized protein LOC116303736 [Actinia tenebrosa]
MRAEERLVSLEKKLLKAPEVAERDKEVMNANIEKGYVRKLVSQSQAVGPAWYLPHFPVIREDKQTTRVRIVFDSAAREQATSLNDAMLTGPKLQKDVMEILLRFREKPVAIVDDIKEMFSQVILAEKDRRFHRFLWRDLDQTRPIDVYEAVRLTFGNRASPYLAQFVVRSHAERFKKEFPLAAAVVLSKMYMDDVLDSRDTEGEAIEVREQLTGLLRRGGFQIRRWCSNKANVLKEIPEEDRATGVKVVESELPCLKTHGLEWNAGKEVFQFTINSNVSSMLTHTKRRLLSRIATLFDPLQFLAPFTIRAKMALQESWLQGLAWDEKLPEDLAYRVSRWIEQLPQLAGLQIQRCLRSEGQVSEVSLHTFTDAPTRHTLQLPTLDTSMEVAT